MIAAHRGCGAKSGREGGERPVLVPARYRPPDGYLYCPSCMAMFRSPVLRCPRDGTIPCRTPADPLAGTVIDDRYVLEDMIGAGATSVVYRAHHARLSRWFAIKMLYGEVAADPLMRMRFCLEAEAGSLLSHPNVVSVVNVGHTVHHLPYLVMEYVRGEDLSTLLAREAPLDPNRVVSLSRQLCRGLGHAHRAGLVHRDFKPANVAVTVTDEGRPLLRILDFGLTISERHGDSLDGSVVREPGWVVGTPIYLSPEQACDDPVDHRADLFALGVVMYEMLAGRPPFGGNPTEITDANVSKRPPALSERNPLVEVSPALEGLVFRLLAKRPDDRPQSADEVIRALDLLRARGALAQRRQIVCRSAPAARSDPVSHPGIDPANDDEATWGVRHDGHITTRMSPLQASNHTKGASAADHHAAGADPVPESLDSPAPPCPAVPPHPASTLTPRSHP